MSSSTRVAAEAAVQRAQAGDSAPAHVQRRPPKEADWNAINRTKFVTSGVLLFGTASTLLYPLSVAKTRLQTYETGSLLGALRRLVQQDGVRGLYRGYSVAILGTLPVRVAYLSVLEATRTKLRAQALPPAWEVPESARIWAADFTAGAMSSLVSQAVLVPVCGVCAAPRGCLRTNVHHSSAAHHAPSHRWMW
jgi:hypothetical protein